ncbi:hypothetical protein BDV96DRAFT_278648 [Lophiotrema nucula]|uniref:Zn(2)-C6 fungal-type domain-containing protein n=1 Tax=Lophiotrema nucula TaxID=690887 RepID=A0A6A5ZRI4_9PLEO|nr:hypothetical protein BDV96DRAFT_278648 [Lophiotrema nucula]
MPEKKRTRASHPKVRTGCHTCKARRVKCDEQRPACQKCINTGRKCDGYKNNREWVIVVAPPPPVTDGFEDDRSRRHFDYFRTQAVYELSWFFEDGDWGKLVLKQSHMSPAVRHAVIALACSHEDFRDNLTVASMAPQYAYAAQHYSKAIRNLIKETSDDAQESRVRALICGLLFISIELLRGNNIAALHHLDGCLKIVQEAQAKMDHYFYPGDPPRHFNLESEEHLSEAIIPMFARLDVQAGLLLGRRPENRGLIPITWHPSRDIQIEEPPLGSFRTMLECCNALLLIANRIHDFMALYSDLYRHEMLRPIPDDVLAYHAMLYDQLMQWEDAIQCLLNSPLSWHNYDKLKLMRIHHRTALTLLESSLHSQETHLDNFEWAFSDIVQYTAELQERLAPSDDGSASDSDSSSDRSTGGFAKTWRCQQAASQITRTGLLKYQRRPFFLLDNGVIFSLYWVALKSRDGNLRRRAISLLDSSTQEGVWIGPIQAAVARRIVEIEEQHPYEKYPSFERIKDACDIPEYIRVHSVATDIDKIRRTAKLVVLRRLNGDEGCWHETVDWVTW